VTKLECWVQENDPSKVKEKLKNNQTKAAPVNLPCKKS
jgi:hypothetical protein